MTRRLHGSPGRLRCRHRGAALVEFAILAFVLYFIIAAVFTFGRALFVAQALQQTTDLFAHELARTPLPPTDTLAQALADPSVQQHLFNEADLQIDITSWVKDDGGQSLDEYLASPGATADGAVPIINRLLAPLMIVDARSDGKTYLWYPGAVQDADGHYYVQVLKGNGTGAPLKVPVVEAMGEGTAQSPDPFAVTVNDGVVSGGLAGVRLNYPFQSASLSAMTYTTPGGGTPQGIPVGVTGVKNSYIQTNEAPDYGATRGGLYGGPDHLGQQQVAGMTVRPFQRMISAQAVYRREVFGQ